MSIDYNKNNYIKIEPYTNVVQELEKSRTYAANAPILFSAMKELIYKLALRHPEWQFVGEDGWYDNSKDAYTLKRFRVYENHDQIGHIIMDSWRSEKFEIRNPRISTAMSKRNHKTTKDVSKAIKIVEEFFSGKTMGERVAEGTSKALNVINSMAWNTSRKFENVMEKLTPALTTYVVLNMDRVRPTLEAYGAPASALDVLSERHETKKLFISIAQAKASGKGTTVMLHGDRYIIARDSELEPTVLAASQLDEDMRTKLGILKVVEDTEAVESIGIRINSTTFYLLP